jgi:hypothetical protein
MSSPRLQAGTSRSVPATGTYLDAPLWSTRSCSRFITRMRRLARRSSWETLRPVGQEYRDRLRAEREREPASPYSNWLRRQLEQKERAEFSFQIKTHATLNIKSPTFRSCRDETEIRISSPRLRIMIISMGYIRTQRKREWKDACVRKGLTDKTPRVVTAVRSTATSACLMSQTFTEPYCAYEVAQLYRMLQKGKTCVSWLTASVV